MVSVLASEVTAQRPAPPRLYLVLDLAPLPETRAATVLTRLGMGGGGGMTGLKWSQTDALLIGRVHFYPDLRIMEELAFIEQERLTHKTRKR